jgi:hypothetical protein
MEDHSGMTMDAFNKFDPYAFLARNSEPETGRCDTLAALATLAPVEECAHDLARSCASPPGSVLAAFAGLAGPQPQADLQMRDGAWPVSAAKAAKIANPDSAQSPANKPPQSWIDGVAQLDAERVPGDVPPRRWRQFIYDAARFLDSGFAAQAAALDWDALDLFGCDQKRPYARIDNAGLIWLLNGDRLVALTEQSARIETKSGATLTYYRKPGGLGRALAWELDPMSQRPILTRNTENE